MIKLVNASLQAYSAQFVLYLSNRKLLSQSEARSFCPQESLENIQSQIWQSRALPLDSLSSQLKNSVEPGLNFVLVVLGLSNVACSRSFVELHDALNCQLTVARLRVAVKGYFWRPPLSTELSPHGFEVCRKKPAGANPAVPLNPLSDFGRLVFRAVVNPANHRFHVALKVVDRLASELLF